jgi:hypothetical protein
VRDRTVLARRVEALQDDEQRPAPLGVQARLQLAEALAVGGAQLARLLLVQPGRVRRVVLGQREPAGGDPVAGLEVGVPAAQGRRAFFLRRMRSQRLSSWSIG